MLNVRRCFSGKRLMASWNSASALSPLKFVSLSSCSATAPSGLSSETVLTELLPRKVSVSFMAMRYSQVDMRDSPRNLSMLVQAFMKVFCTRSLVSSCESTMRRMCQYICWLYSFTMAENAEALRLSFLRLSIISFSLYAFSAIIVAFLQFDAFYSQRFNVCHILNTTPSSAHEVLGNISDASFCSTPVSSYRDE